jgi:hypothetical protein
LTLGFVGGNKFIRRFWIANPSAISTFQSTPNTVHAINDEDFLRITPLMFAGKGGICLYCWRTYSCPFEESSSNGSSSIERDCGGSISHSMLGRVGFAREGTCQSQGTCQGIKGRKCKLQILCIFILLFFGESVIDHHNTHNKNNNTNNIIM